MPDRINQLGQSIYDFFMLSPAGQAVIMSIIGASIGIGQILSNDNNPPLRLIIGRALSNGGLAMGAGAVLVWIPDVPFLAMIGIASILSSLGTSGLEKVLGRIIQGRI